MNSALWLLMPMKQPLYKCLDGDSKVIESDPADRLRTVGVQTRWRNQDLEIKLDPLHGWLPKRVALGSGKTQHYWNVTEFKELNGIWYPAEGRFTSVVERIGLVEKAFRITAIKINHPVGLERFALPILQDGTLVSDELIHKNYIKGPTQ